MNPDDLAKILDELGQRLGPAGQHVFELAIRQQIIGGVFWLVATAAVLILAVVITRGCRAALQADAAKNAKDSYRIGDAAEIRVLGGAAVVTCMVVALFAFGIAMNSLLNPEYAAIRDILGAIRP